jgi:hypothetical protein
MYGPRARGRETAWPSGIDQRVQSLMRIVSVTELEPDLRETLPTGSRSLSVVYVRTPPDPQAAPVRSVHGRTGSRRVDVPGRTCRVTYVVQ